jgi:hypothetical protein
VRSFLLGIGAGAIVETAHVTLQVSLHGWLDCVVKYLVSSTSLTTTFWCRSCPASP